MKKVFIDTSVLLAAAKSNIGASRYILMLCKKGILQGYISRYVIFEAKKQNTLTQLEKQRLNYFLLQCNLIIAQEADDSFIREYSLFIEKKDAPIIATALSIPVDVLLTFNTKDFMTKKLRSHLNRVAILTPKKLIRLVR